MHFRARSYFPAIGRFMQRDPKDRFGQHYLYGQNNPVGMVDPMGLDPGDWWDPRTWWENTKNTTKTVVYITKDAVQNAPKRVLKLGKGFGSAAKNFSYETLAMTYDIEQTIAVHSGFMDPHAFRARSSMGKGIIKNNLSTGDVFHTMGWSMVNTPNRWYQSFASGDPERMGRSLFEIEMALYGAGKGVKNFRIRTSTKTFGFGFGGGGRPLAISGGGTIAGGGTISVTYPTVTVSGSAPAVGITGSTGISLGVSGTLERALHGPLLAEGSGTGGVKYTPDKLPGNASKIKDPKEIYRRLEKYHGVNKHKASSRLHKIKDREGFSPNDDVLFDKTGGVYDPKTLRKIGDLTQPQ